MLLTVNLRPDTYNRILGLVESGAYESPASFLQMAVENQLVAEEAQARTWHSALVTSAPPATGTPPVGSPVAGGASVAAGVPSMPSAPVATNVSPALSPMGAPRVSSALKVSRAAPVSTPQASRDSTVGRLGQIREKLRLPSNIDIAPCEPHAELAEPWPFGQINRFFPFKLICRFLLASARNGRWPDSRAAVERLASVAQDMGALLVRLDEENGRGRAEALATAFPSGEPESADRFVWQFGGRITLAGARPGALAGFQLACFDEARFALTAHGIEFARLPNPLLDGDGAPPVLLSSQEKRFLLELIRKWVPGERDALSVVLGAITQGAERFDDVVEAARPSTPAQWGPVFLQTQTSGVISRAYELGLLEKERTGRRVSYRLTSAGAEALRAFTDSSQGGGNGYRA